MARRLVESDSEVAANFHTFIKLRVSKKPEERAKYASFLRQAKILVVEKIDGKREYAPSRFVGYRRNTLAAHEADTERNGTVTTPKLEEIYDHKWTYDAEEAERYVRFCRSHGIEKEVDHLRTPLKFIFSGFYKPSAVATRTNPNRAVATVANRPMPFSEKNVTAFPLNQILYGPPGTGKTYHTAVRALGLLEGLTDAQITTTYPTREALRTRYDELRQIGRIQFVTFHQAFSYEDFVEGIKPVPPTQPSSDEAEETSAATSGLQYAIQDGVFKRLCETAAAAATPEQLAISIPFDELYDGFVAQLEQQREASGGLLILPTKEGKPVMLTAVNKGLPGRLSFHHSTATGQEHHQDKSWIKKIYDKYTSVDQITHLKKHLTDAIGGTNASLQYVVFRELKKYEAQRLAEARRKQQTQPAPRFVLIIDEINRGNVANIFGELITLLEDDKRAGRPEALTVKLPYSKEDFTVPDNLYLLGTMNTADRSVEALDTALRRRFSFTEMRPDAQVIHDHVGEGGKVEGVDVAQILEVLNSRLEQLLDRDHCLGHALLLRVTDLDGLRAAFQRNVLPLLQEYFFGDWGKIGLVLGERFITTADKTATRYPLAKFSGYDSSGPRERPLYRLTAPDTWDTAAFQSIYAVA
jgi:5-methylcytosine-specific restriction protein B